MGDKDTISKEILTNMARDISKHILRIDIKDDMELISHEFSRVEKRESDLLYKNGDEIVHIEIQNDNHKQMHLRMHRYLSDILFRFETKKIKQYLLYIGKTRCNMKDHIKLEKLSYCYDIIDIRDIPCESFLDSNDPSALVLAILCDFGDRDKQEVVNTILRKLKSLSDDREFKNYLKMVDIYSTNRDLQKEIEKGLKMLTVDLEETTLFKMGENRGKFEERLENAIIMIKDFQISIDDVVKKLNIKKEELLEYMKQKNKD